MARGEFVSELATVRYEEPHFDVAHQNSSSHAVESTSRWLAGSSPRTRRTHRGARPGVGRERFIPTHAGNTYFAATKQTTSTVHPRARGEHFFPCLLRVSSYGSSPRTRGTHRSNAHKRNTRRFIPAHAGNTQISTVLDLPDSGSSPRTRGTRPRAARNRSPPRFIPAHAGNTSNANAAL